MRRRRFLLFALPVLLFVLLLILLSMKEEDPLPPVPDGSAPAIGEPALPPPPPPEPPAPAGPVPEDEEGDPAPPAGVVTGRAILGGKPSSGGIVIRVARYEDPGDDPDTPNWFEAVTAADGSFRFDGLPPGRYGLVARHPDRLLGQKRKDFVIPPGGGAGPFDLVWEEGGTIVVQLGVVGSGRSGERVGLDRVITRGRTSAVLSNFRTGKTDEEGRIEFEDLEPGGYSVDWSGRSLPATVESGRETLVTFEGTCSVRGRVLGPDGKPLVGALVRLGLVPGPGERYRSVQAKTDAKGNYAIEDFAPGEFRVRLQTLGKNPYVCNAGHLTFRAGGALTHDIRVRDTAISGRVTRSDTKEGLTRGQIQISARQIAGNGDGSAWADDRGRFTFIGLPPGRYRIWVAPLRVPMKGKTVTVTLPDSGRLEGVEIALDPR